MRFLADMGVSLRVVEWLRRQGYDAKHLREENLHKLSDREIFKRATAENRVVLTFDLDFGEIVALTEGERASVILFRLHDTRAVHVIDRLRTILADLTPLPGNSVVIVEEQRYRVRRFPD